MNIGLVGCGNISGQYLKTISEQDSLTLVAVADIDRDRAEDLAATLPGVRALSVSELLEAPDVDVVVNLTIPAAHAEVALAAIAANKDVYGEKPLAATTGEAQEVLAAAARAGVRVGCAPDTVLGTGVQTARDVIDKDLIGTPISATATMISTGPEPWHPNPDFFYQEGAGPLFDMGPYYVSALVTLLGPVTSVVGSASRRRAVREIGSGPRAGASIPVNVDTHVTGLLTHASGAISTLVISFDGVATRASSIEVHGAQGSLVVPDPNGFHGDVLLRTPQDTEWQKVASSAGYQRAGRGIGLVDMAADSRGAGRASGELALHVLDVMESIIASAHSRQAVDLKTSCERPEPVLWNAVKAAKI